MTFHNIFDKKNQDKHVEKIGIIADYHEKNSLVIAELIKKGINVKFEALPVADFIIGNVAIERKTVSDFIASMINKRLVAQLEEIKQYPNRFLLIEGIDEQELYNDDNHEGVDSNAIRGFLLSIIVGHHTPILFTKNYEDTAAFLSILAKKEKTPHTSYRPVKRSLNIREQLQYILEGFPGIGPATAKKLIARFGSIKNIVEAAETDITNILGKKAESFRHLISYNAHNAP